MPTKSHIHAALRQHIAARAQRLQQDITDLQESRASDTKSSAGDKFETAREMLQQVENRTAAQLRLAREQLALLDRLDPNQLCSSAVPGSLVRTDRGTYYLAVAYGKLSLAGMTYFCVSPASPAGRAITFATAGTKLDFGGGTTVIEVT